jgi:hypothetical protein
LGRRVRGVFFKLPAGNLRGIIKVAVEVMSGMPVSHYGREKWPSQYEAGVLIISHDTLLATSINDHAPLYARPVLPQMNTVKQKRSTVTYLPASVAFALMDMASTHHVPNIQSHSNGSVF